MATLDKVLIIGDSISVYYTPFVAAELEGRFAVAHNEGNASDSRNIVARLDDYLAADAEARLVHLNCGLHDSKLAVAGRGHQVPLEEYRENLNQIVGRLRASGRRLVWATTTPILDGRHLATHSEFRRYNRDVLERNAVAARVMAEAGIPVNDLYAVVAEAGPEVCICQDGVHMTEAGSKLLARAVARAIQRTFPDTK
ncbi:MAG: hypothetical protein GWP05_10270 [Anaerolineaceae bacterium]|nr:hypothetical protein [Anaerolineaceae bacterium]